MRGKHAGGTMGWGGWCASSSLALGALGLLLPAAPLAAQDRLPIHDRVLENGLHVIVIENHAVPSVTVELDVKNGAYTETPEFDGLSHLYEHMFFKANRTIPSQEEYLERLDELGADWHATTSTERVNYFITVDVDSLRAAMQFMEDAIRRPLFLDQELAWERLVVLGEYDRAESNPVFQLGRATDTLLWGPSYYSRKNVIGDPEVLASAPKAKLEAIRARYYVPNNTALILAGDLTAERGFALAEEVFADWPRGPDPFAQTVPDPPPLAASRVVIVEWPVRAATLFMRWQGPSVDDDPVATYAADVLAEILANPASRFQKALVDSGLAFSAGFSYYPQTHVGPIAIQAQTSPENVVDVRQAILAEVARLGEAGYVSEEELEAARTAVEIGQTYGRERASDFAHTVGFWWAVAGLDYYRGYVDGIQAMTRDDLARLARDYMVGKPYVAGVLISPEDRATIDLRLLALLPGEGPP